MDSITHDRSGSRHAVSCTICLAGEGPADEETGSSLWEHAGSLVTLASVIAGASVRIFPVADAGGIRGLDLLLPEQIPARGEEGRLHYVVRASISAELSRRRAWAQRSRDPALAELEVLHVTRGAIETLCDRLPGFAARHDAAARRELAWRPDVTRLAGRERWLECARQAALRGERPWESAALIEALRAAIAPDDDAGDGLALWGARIEPPAPLRIDVLRHGLPPAASLRPPEPRSTTAPQ